MKNNEELYAAIGAILKELKIELSGNLSDYINSNSAINKGTSDNIALLLDEVDSLNEKINTNSKFANWRTLEFGHF